MSLKTFLHKLGFHFWQDDFGWRYRECEICHEVQSDFGYEDGVYWCTISADEPEYVEYMNLKKEAEFINSGFPTREEVEEQYNNYMQLAKSKKLDALVQFEKDYNEFLDGVLSKILDAHVSDGSVLINVPIDMPEIWVDFFSIKGYNMEYKSHNDNGSSTYIISWKGKKCS